MRLKLISAAFLCIMIAFLADFAQVTAWVTGHSSLPSLLGQPPTSIPSPEDVQKNRIPYSWITSETYLISEIKKPPRRFSDLLPSNADTIYFGYRKGKVFSSGSVVLIARVGVEAIEYELIPIKIPRNARTFYNATTEVGVFVNDELSVSIVDFQRGIVSAKKDEHYSCLDSTYRPHYIRQLSLSRTFDPSTQRHEAYITIEMNGSCVSNYSQYFVSPKIDGIEAVDENERTHSVLCTQIIDGRQYDYKQSFYKDHQTYTLIFDTAWNLVGFKLFWTCRGQCSTRCYPLYGSG